MSSPRTIDQLRADPTITQILSADAISFFIKHAANIKFALDIDGTLTSPGQKISPDATKVLYALVDYIVLITAQAASYVDNNIGLKQYPNLVSEQSFTVRIDGIEDTDDAPPEVPSFTREMEELLGGLNSKFVFNKKAAGYAVGWENIDFVPEDLAKVKALMEAQVAGSAGKYRFDATAGFYDIVLAALNKERGIDRIHGKGRFPRSTVWVAMGDSPNTDGPMLRKAKDYGGMGIMVTKELTGFETIPTFHDTIVVLEWFSEVKSAFGRL